MRGFNLDVDVNKSEYTRYVDVDNRWYHPISELLRQSQNTDDLTDSSIVKEIKKNQLEIRWNTQWKSLNENKNVRKFYIIFGSASKSLTHMIDSKIVLVGALANISCCEYYSNGVLKETSKPTEHISCLYALADNMNTLIVPLDERSLSPQKAYTLCDLVLKL